MSIILEYLVT